MVNSKHDFRLVLMWLGKVFNLSLLNFDFIPFFLSENFIFRHFFFFKTLIFSNFVFFALFYFILFRTTNCNDAQSRTDCQGVNTSTVCPWLHLFYNFYFFWKFYKVTYGLHTSGLTPVASLYIDTQGIPIFENILFQCLNNKISTDIERGGGRKMSPHFRTNASSFSTDP